MTILTSMRLGNLFSNKDTEKKKENPCLMHFQSLHEIHSFLTWKWL